MHEQIRQQRTNYSSLWRPRHAQDDATILHLHWRLQPAFDVEQHPAAIRMLANRLEHQLPIKTVEVGLNVKIEHPVIAPAALSRCAHGVDRRFAGPVTVGVGMKHRLQDWLQVTTGNFLSDSVSDRGDAQRPNATTIPLWNVDPPHRRRKVTP